jgi:phosphotriesterase-related protein
MTKSPSSHQSSSGHVNTATGPIDPRELGVTLPHEHILIDLTCYWSPPSDESLHALAQAPLNLEALGLSRTDPFFSRDNCLLSDLETATEEVGRFRELGGRTIVDVTLRDIGRDAAALQEISKATGVNVVLGSGHYVHIAHPPELEDASIDAVAESIETEITDGIDGTHIRAGVIGEIGTSEPLHPREEKVLRAAGRAQVRTGVPITLHMHPTALAGYKVLDILIEEGVEPERVVMGHMDNNLALADATRDNVLAYQAELARRGCYIQYDCCGNDTYYPESSYSEGYWLPSDRERVEALRVLFDAGFGMQLLLSQDICKKTQLVRYGGVGYAHVLRTFVGHLRRAGFGDRELTTLLVDNPRRMLAPA